MILNRFFKKSVTKIDTLFLKINTKNCPSESKKGIRDFFPKQRRGVITPSWRKIGGKKCLIFFGTNKFVL